MTFLWGHGGSKRYILTLLRTFLGSQRYPNPQDVRSVFRSKDILLTDKATRRPGKKHHKDIPTPRMYDPVFRSNDILLTDKATRRPGKKDHKDIPTSRMYDPVFRLNDILLTDKATRRPGKKSVAFIHRHFTNKGSTADQTTCAGSRAICPRPCTPHAAAQLQPIHALRLRRLARLAP